MSKSKVLIASLFLSTMSHAAESPSLSSDQIVENESTMAIMKDAQDQHITLANVKPFLATENASDNVRTLVVSYIAQGLSFSDFKKVSEGVFALIPKVGVSAKTSQVHYNQKCYTAPVGQDYCYNAVNWTCTDINSNVCM